MEFFANKEALSFCMQAGFTGDEIVSDSQTAISTIISVLLLIEKLEEFLILRLGMPYFWILINE